MTDREYWEKCVAFHGHQCPGLTIGFKASLYAMELLNIDFSKDEEVVCVTENDACGVDAVQVILGCSVGKGNLLFRPRGKQAFSFFNRKTGKSVRLVLRDMPKMDRPEMFSWMQAQKPSDLFDVKEPGFVLPEHARIFNSIKCECCGENVSENMIRIENGKSICLDCLNPYDRFNV
ncbi:MAG: formylmethanofuran dehydrogenase [Clostridia bacterium]|nr:formylmethanofuran dehydrogenase [Clostridia bacterium]NCC68275.1 formylmethanofuran dehydrogenase [Clostridia bacterium]